MPIPTHPEVIRDFKDFQVKAPWVSIDFEFSPRDWKPTIIGMTSGGSPHSTEWTDSTLRLLKELNDQQVTWLGHNALTVEKQIIERELGVDIPVQRIEDTLLRHYLCNSELCKGSVKGTGDEDEDTHDKGMGYMDLWSMASLYTDLPQWKKGIWRAGEMVCLVERCAGPCPVHDPFGYNGLDTYAPDIALPKLIQEMKEKQIPEGLYENLKKLTLLCQKMSENGIKVDRSLVAKLEKEFQETKDSIFTSQKRFRIGKKGQQLKSTEIIWNAPFNPRSSQQIREYFTSHGVALSSTEKEDIEAAIDHLPSGIDLVVADWLGKLSDYKDAGKGLSPWVNERYFDYEGLLHSRFNPTGSSLGRLASSNPNLQNIPRVGWGRGVRAAIIPRDSSLQLVKADKSQLELRVVLWSSEVEPPKGDVFTWLVETSGGLFEQIVKDNPQKGWTERDWTKSVSHGGNYMEGVKIFYGKDLQSSYNKRLIEQGAIIVHRDWEAFGGVVGFTGTNLSERLFGSASWEKRSMANKIQEAYFGRFTAIRNWHRKVVRDAERGYVQSASGRYLTLLGSPEDKIKIAAAFYGQGGGADDVQEGMLRYQKLGEIPVLQVHDELVFEKDRNITDKALLEFFSVFSQESKYMPGFVGPVKVSRGDDWLHQIEVGKV